MFANPFVPCQHPSRVAKAAFATVSDLVTKRVVEAQKVKDVRGLSKAHKTQLDELVVWIVASLNPNEPLTADLVYNLMAGSDSEAFDSDECRSVIEIFQAEAVATSSRDEKSEVIANAIALVHSGLEEEEETEEDDNEEDDE